MKNYWQNKGYWRDKLTSQKNSFILLHSNDFKPPYIDIYFHELPINFKLLSVHLHCAYNHLSDYNVYTALTTNMVAI